MHFERLTSADDPRFSAAMEGYAVSFPPHEQREPASQRAIMTDPAYRFNLIYNGGAPVGAMLYWETETFIYVEHFFILPHLRGHACGSRALALLGGRGKTVILEIDPPADDVSLRRRGFYERAGFHENPYRHVHPPYHAGNRGHVLSARDFGGGVPGVRGLSRRARHGALNGKKACFSLRRAL